MVGRSGPFVIAVKVQDVHQNKIWFRVQVSMVQGLRIASLEAKLSLEVGGTLRSRFEAKTATSEFFASNLQPQASNNRRFGL
jgi:hypothetical protein